MPQMLNSYDPSAALQSCNLLTAFLAGAWALILLTAIFIIGAYCLGYRWKVVRKRHGRS